MTKAELLASNIVGIKTKARDGTAVNLLINANDGRAGFFVGTCDNDWFNAMRATSLVHKHIEKTLGSLDTLSAVLTDAGMDDVANTLDTIAAGLRLGQHVALVGIESMTKE